MAWCLFADSLRGCSPGVRHCLRWTQQGSGGVGQTPRRAAVLAFTVQTLACMISRQQKREPFTHKTLVFLGVAFNVSI